MVRFIHVLWLAVLCLAAASGASAAEGPGRASIVVAPVRFEASVRGKPANFETVLQRDIATSLEATGLFTVPNRDRADLNAVLDEIVTTGKRGAKAIPAQYIVTVVVTAMELGERRRANPMMRDTDIMSVSGTMALRLTVMKVSDAKVTARMSVDVAYRGKDRLADPRSYSSGPVTFAGSQTEFVALSSVAAKAVAKRVLDQVNPVLVIQRTGDQLWLSRGEDSGYAVGEMVRILKVGAELRHPVTGELLDKSDVEIGQAKIIEVRPRVSIARVISSTEPIGAGAIVREPVADEEGW